MNKFREIRRKATLSIKRNNAQKDLSEIGKRAIETKEKRNAVQNTLDNKGYLSKFLLKNSLNNGRKEVNNTVKSFKTFYDSNPKRLFTSAKRALTSERRANAARSLTKKRNATQRELSEIGKKTNETQKKRNNTQSTLARHGRMSKIFLPKNKENNASTKRKLIQKYVKSYENNVKNINGAVIYRQNIFDELKGLKHQPKSKSSATRPMPRPRIRNPSRSSASNEPKTMSASRSMPRPRSRSRALSNALQSQSKEAHPKSLKTMSAPRPRVSSRYRSSASKDKNETEVKAEPEKKNVTEDENKEVRESMNGLNQMMKYENKEVNPTLLKECEESYAKLKLEMNEMEFSLHHNKREHEQSNNILYSLLQDRNIDYVSLDHKFKDEEQTKYGAYKKSYEEIDKLYKMIVTFYKEYKGRCLSKDTEEECYTMHKILRTEFNIMKIARDYYYEQREQTNKLVHSIMDRELDELDMLVKRHFKDDEQATYAYYRKSHDEVNKTYKKVLESYYKLTLKCRDNPRVKELFSLQMSELRELRNVSFTNE
jgi:hypothetical protein